MKPQRGSRRKTTKWIPAGVFVFFAEQTVKRVTKGKKSNPWKKSNQGKKRKKGKKRNT